MAYHIYHSVAEILALAWENYNRKIHRGIGGVYMIAEKATNEIIYVGKSKDFSRRLVGSKRHKVYKAHVYTVKVFRIDDENERSLTEEDLISILRPRENAYVGRMGVYPQKSVDDAYHQLFG